MKKMIALLLTISLLLVVFAGCSAQKQETSEPAATESTPQQRKNRPPRKSRRKPRLKRKKRLPHLRKTWIGPS